MSSAPEETPPSPVRLVYHLPPIGNASLTLHNESADLYRFLDVVGEVDRLKRLDHLGLIRVASGGAHHPRWEYAITVLNLIKHCKEVPEVHLGTRVRLVGDAEVSSGEELMRCWALLLSVGHLPGTFSTERALMFEIWRNTAHRSAFLELFPEGAVRDWVRGVMKTGRVYSFSQALGFIRLDDMAADGTADVTLLGTWRQMYELYALPTSNPHVGRLKLIFRNLRRLAFLSLDSHYTPAVIGLKLTQILSDPTALGKLALHNAELDSEEDELHGLEQHLYHEVYLSRPSLQAVGVREHRLSREIRRALSQHGPRDTIGSLARNELQGGILIEEVDSVVRLTAWGSGILNELLLEPVNVRIRQAALDNDPMVRRTGVRPIWWAAPYGREWALQIHASPMSLAAQTVALNIGFAEIKKLNERLLDRMSGVLDYTDVHTYLMERFADELILAAFKILFDTPVRWEWVPATPGPRALLSTRRLAREHVRGLIRRSDLTFARKEELAVLRSTLIGRPDAYVVTAVANLVAYSPDQQVQMVELDGATMEVFPDHRVVLKLIEVKNQRSGAQAAATAQLRQALRRLGPRAELGEVEVLGSSEGRQGRAWVSLVLPSPDV